MEELSTLNPSNWQYFQRHLLISLVVNGRSVSVALPLDVLFSVADKEFQLPPTVGAVYTVGGWYSKLKKKAKKMAPKAVKRAASKVRNRVERVAKRAAKTAVAKAASKYGMKAARFYARPEFEAVAQGVASTGIPLVSSAAGGVAAGSRGTRYALEQYDRGSRAYKAARALRKKPTLANARSLQRATR